MLKDTFNRIHDYLRISVTDKCNLNCVYCMPNKQHAFLPNSRIMSASEIYEIARTFVSLGIKKIRLTGGEPLIRPDIITILEKLNSLPVELAITTNGYYVDKYITHFRRLGLKNINISLDTLEDIKFIQITGKDGFHKVYHNICLLLEYHYHPKINVVLMRHINDQEIHNFIEWTKHLPIHIRFIEYMPFDGNQWNVKHVVPIEEILQNLQNSGYKTEKLTDKAHSTSKSFRIKGYKGTFAVISTVSEPFCNSCNRIRITADGKMRNCLFAQSETDLLSPLRNKKDIIPLIQQNILSKSFKRGGLPDFTKEELTEKLSKRKMIEIGG